LLYTDHPFASAQLFRKACESSDSLHQLPQRKLQALTVVHNYWLKRGDGTTAAERFFGSKPADLFEYLVAHLPVPARPAKRRPKAA
jgi:Family of unknown function (DUF6399)